MRERGGHVNGTAKLRFGDVEVQRIGLGTNRLRNTPANLAFLREAAAAGIGHIDTAHTYTGGESEETIGAALSPIPEQCIVATKGGWAGGRPDALRAEIDQSLLRLRTDSIPLYYLHRPDPETPLEDSLAAIKEHHDTGKIRHVGVSNVGIDQIERARAVVPITAVQNNYSLSERRHEDVVDYCANEGIVFVPYFPLRSDADTRSPRSPNDTTPRTRRSRSPGSSGARRQCCRSRARCHSPTCTRTSPRSRSN